jgi:hypothetical protein
MTVIIDGTSGITYPSTTVQNTAYQTRFKNRFINGNMVIAQRANSATVTAGTAVPTASTGYPAVDRWFVYSTGANVTAAQVAGSNNTQNNYQITGAASVTAVGVGQRIENNNSYDLAGQTVTLSVNMSNSLLTNVTWTASYANTSNTFGTIGTPTKVQISTGTFVVNSTLSQYSTQISLPSNATTGVEILFTVGAQTSGTWVIGNAQLEVGSAASSFEIVNYSDQLFMCQRYYETYALSSTSLVGVSTSTTVAATVLTFKVTKRTAPTITLPAAGQTSGTVTFLTSIGDYPAATGTNTAASITVDKATINGSGYTGLTSGSTSLFFSSSTSTIQINAEL